jgi:hypothetical protein
VIAQRATEDTQRFAEYLKAYVQKVLALRPVCFGISRLIDNAKDAETSLPAGRQVQHKVFKSKEKL